MLVCAGPHPWERQAGDGNASIGHHQEKAMNDSAIPSAFSILISGLSFLESPPRRAGRVWVLGCFTHHGRGGGVGGGGAGGGGGVEWGGGGADGQVVAVAYDLRFPNGIVITPDGQTLIVAETLGNRLSAFAIADDGSLGARADWAKFGPLPEGSDLPAVKEQIEVAPDGVALDDAGAVWLADAISHRVLRVARGGRGGGGGGGGGGGRAGGGDAGVCLRAGRPGWPHAVSVRCARP